MTRRVGPARRAWTDAPGLLLLGVRVFFRAMDMVAALLAGEGLLRGTLAT